MATLQCAGDDPRNLLDVLIEAVRIAASTGAIPSIAFAGETYGGFDIGKAAGHLPDESLLPHHRLKIEQIFTKRQETYLGAGRNLVIKAQQVVSAKRALARQLDFARFMRPHFHVSLEIKPFQNRGLSKRTVQACAECGIDFPERLLFMNENDLKKIPGVGNVSLAELKAYRAKFLG